MIIISACLVGLPTRYDLERINHSDLLELVQKGLAIPICPEQIGGLPTPRPAATIEEGEGCDVVRGISKILNSEGEDVTENFLRGAYAALEIAKAIGVEEAIFKEGSPSCGVNYTNRRFRMIKGMGVLAYLSSINGIKLRGVD